MAGRGTNILAADFNQIHSKTATVLGSGSGNYGYGQVVSSTQVSPTETITAAKWLALRTDLIKARQHQLGTDLSDSLPFADVTLPLTETGRAQYAQMAETVSADANRLITPPPSQATREYLIPIQQRTTWWNGTITQTITVNFSNADAARYFFNTGSQIEFSASRSDNVGVYQYAYSASKSDSWTYVLSSMGTVAFNHTETKCSGIGSNSNIGFYDLTTADQLIFAKTAAAGVYASNKYYIYARKNAESTQITFRIEFRDDATGNVDEPVDGVLRSICQVYRASGSNVSVQAPTATTSGLPGGQVVIVTPPATVPTYTISPSALAVSENTSITYTINTTNVSSGTILFWTVAGTITSADITGGIASGSVSISNNTASFTLQIAADQVIEGTENIFIRLRTGSITGPIIATSPTTVIYDTTVAPPPPPGYYISPSSTAVTENTAIFYIVGTTNVPDNTVLYWTLDGTANAADIAGGLVNGLVLIQNNSASFSLDIKADQLTEGTENIFVRLRTNSITGPIVATSETTTIYDTSTTPAPIPTYSISPEVSAISENAIVTYNIQTTNVLNGTLIYWSILGQVTSADITGGVTSGTVSIVNNSASFGVQILADQLTEGTETLYVRLRTDSQSGPVVATSSTTVVYDTSTTPPPPPPSGSATFTTGGATYTWTVPPGVYSVKATAIGAGGAGGHSRRENDQFGGGGGGSGAILVKTLSVNPGEMLTVKVGLGAVGASGTSSGLYKNGVTLVRAVGGSMGGNATAGASNTNGSVGQPGAGGYPGGIPGTIGKRCANAQNIGYGLGVAPGGDGGSLNAPNYGANAGYGGMGGGTRPLGIGASYNGYTGPSAGDGGGGAGAEQVSGSTVTAPWAGGAGAHGKVTIEWGPTIVA